MPHEHLRYRDGYLDMSNPGRDEKTRLVDLTVAATSPMDANGIALTAQVLPGMASGKPSTPESLQVTVQIDPRTVTLVAKDGLTTGQLDVLGLLSAVDVAAVINPLAHQMQIDGGSAMGYGYVCLEDLDEGDGQVWAANLGEYKLASSRDVPDFTTVLVPGGIGLGTANVKNIGESTTPPVAAAIANAVASATGCRIRDLPLSAEKIYAALQVKSSGVD